MPGQVIKGHMTVGIADHGMPCCPHVITGMHLGGSPASKTDGQPAVRVNDYTTHTCPHCGSGMASVGSDKSIIDGQKSHRLGDAVNEFCGIGSTISASSQSLVDG